MHIYKMKFADEAQADAVLAEALTGVQPWEYDKKTIGIHKTYVSDEENPEAEPTVTVYEGWHVDLVSRVELSFDPTYIVEPKNPIHQFAGM